MAKIIEVPADIHEDVDKLFAILDPKADAMVTELLQDRIRGLAKIADAALLTRYRKGFDHATKTPDLSNDFQVVTFPADADWRTTEKTLIKKGQELYAIRYVGSAGPVFFHFGYTNKATAQEVADKFNKVGDDTPHNRRNLLDFNFKTDKPISIVGRETSK